MDNDSILRKDKLELGGILRESLRIPAKNPKLLAFVLFTSIPLFISLLLFEFILQDALFKSVHTLLFDDSPDTTYCDGTACFMSATPWDQDPFRLMNRLVSKHFQQFALLVSIYLIVVPLDLLNTILILCHSSALYAGETLQSFRGFLLRPIKGFGFRGPLITSLYVLVLSALVAAGLVSFGTQLYQFQAVDMGLLSYGLYSVSYGEEPFELVLKLVSSLVFGVLSLALLMKYIEWSSVWNVGITLSVLEEKHWDIAIGVAGYISRGSRRRGFLLMLVFFMWRLCLRSLCLYLIGGKKCGVVGATVAQVLGVCVGNLIKWVAIMVYYCDCKKRYLEKKIDVEHWRLVVHK